MSGYTGATLIRTLRPCQTSLEARAGNAVKVVAAISKAIRRTIGLRDILGKVPFLWGRLRLHEGRHQRLPSDNRKQGNVFFNLACCPDPRSGSV